LKRPAAQICLWVAGVVRRRHRDPLRKPAARLAETPADGALAARIASYELAARMQLAVPGVADLSTDFSL
jgi:hypothetical protein